MIKNEIGTLAGTIWHLLDKNRNLSIRQIGELTNENESTIHLSIGWLSRENKVIVRKDSKDQIELELPHQTFY